MNYGYSNNCCSNNYYSSNDCGCATPYEDNSYSAEDRGCDYERSDSCNNCGILLFIIAVILIFWK